MTQPPNEEWGSPQGPPQGQPPAGNQWSPPPGWSSGPPPHKRRRRWPWIVGAVVAVIVIVSLATSGGGGSNKPSVVAPVSPVDSPASPVDSPASAPTSPDVVDSSAAPETTAPIETTPPPAQPKVLLDLSGSGIQNTAQFTAAGNFDVKYTYDCSSFGSTGNFIVDAVSSDAGIDDQDLSIANDLGAGKQNTAHAYTAGGTYHLEINSECSWHVTVVG